MSVANEIIDMQARYAALGVDITELVVPLDVATRLLAERPYRVAPRPGDKFQFFNIRITVAGSKPTEKQQLIDRLRACADQLEKDE